jgi:carbamoyl-phosphate synthase large subunit
MITSQTPCGFVEVMVNLNSTALESKLKSGMNVLVTAASRRVALVQAFQASIRRLGLPGKVITTDNNPLSPGLYRSDKHYMVPLTNHSDYIPIIQQLCAMESVSLVIPTIDDELTLFGGLVEAFAQQGVYVSVSRAEVGTICNDKYETYKFLSQKGLPTARTYLPGDIRFKGLHYPLFLKPRFGRGSVGAHPINNEKELRFFLEYVEEPIVQDFLYGREFTIDVLADFSGRIISVVPRERLLIRAGVVDRGRTLQHAGLIGMGERVAGSLGIRGAVNIQCKLHNDEINIIEINPRFSGGIPLTIAAGGDFPIWLLQLVMGRDVSPKIGIFIDGLTMSCYESCVFLDSELHVIHAEDWNAGLVST